MTAPACMDSLGIGLPPSRGQAPGRSADDQRACWACNLCILVGLLTKLTSACDEQSRQGASALRVKTPGMQGDSAPGVQPQQLTGPWAMSLLFLGFISFLKLG